MNTGGLFGEPYRVTASPPPGRGYWVVGEQASQLYQGAVGTPRTAVLPLPTLRGKHVCFSGKLGVTLASPPYPRGTLGLVGRHFLLSGLRMGGTLASMG